MPILVLDEVSPHWFETALAWPSRVGGRNTLPKGYHYRIPYVLVLSIDINQEINLEY